MKSIYEIFAVLRASLLAGSLFLLTVSSGCATTEIYRLNLDGNTAPATLSAVAHIAGDMGYQTTLLTTAVNVRYDHDTWIYYGMGSHDYSMVVVVDDDVQSDQRGARIQEAKAKAEEIWKIAMALRTQALRSTQPGAVHPTAATSPSS